MAKQASKKMWLGVLEEVAGRWIITYAGNTYVIKPCKLSDSEFVQEVRVSPHSTVRTRLSDEPGREELRRKVQTACERMSNKSEWNTKWELWNMGLPKGADITEVKTKTDNAITAGD